MRYDRGMKRFRAALVGASGYGGAEIIRRLLRHPDVELVRVVAADHIGERVGDTHLALEGATDLRFEKLDPREAAEGMDVVFLALPRGISAKEMPGLIATGARIIDMSGDFRLKSAASYERYYELVHPHPELLGTFVYGLPEQNREAIRGAMRVASPGCFATAVELGLLPLARAGLLPGDVETVGITGSSGSGVVPSATTHHPVRAVNLRTYKPLFHQHVPEIEETLAAAGSNVSLSFVPVSAPLSRGILATSFVRVPESVGAHQLHAIYERAFAGEPFVRVPGRRLPEVAAVAGSTYAEVGAEVGPARGGTRVVSVFSALDNLVKGGAGQAVQSMNLMLGLDERAALDDVAGWP
jgi:N-acetyl-gamma-glutamyl-phosphate reductase